MIVQYLCLMPFLFSFTYVQDITLGAPDTVKILVDPIKVIEINDTIIVLDQEGAFQFIKRYTLDGFFVDARLYGPKMDSLLFSQSWREPTDEIIKKANMFVSKRSGVYVENQKWGAMFIEPDSMIWLVCGYHVGDAGGLGIFACMPDDTVWRASGYGPSADDYSQRTMRSIQYRSYLYVGTRYVYIIAGEFLWQYDRNARFIRQIGIKPQYSFKEPYGIAISEQGYVFITDFRLGTIWECRGHTMRCTPLFSNFLKQETHTHITHSKVHGLWVTDIQRRAILNIGTETIYRSLTLSELRIGPGGTNYKIAFSDSLMLIHEFPYRGKKVLVYDLSGHYLTTYQGTDYEYKYDGLIDMDNDGYSYFFKGFYYKQFFKIDPSGVDTSYLVFPDSFFTPNLAWQRSYRTGDTLYLLSSYTITHTDSSKTTTRGFLVFVKDTLDYAIPEAEFEGGLPECITDFAVQSYGLIWIVDIENRIVHRYRLLPQKQE